MNADRAWLGVADLARDADVHQDTIFRLIRSGKLPMVKVGRHVRIPREAAEALLAGRPL